MSELWGFAVRVFKSIIKEERQLYLTNASIYSLLGVLLVVSRARFSLRFDATKDNQFTSDDSF